MIEIADINAVAVASDVNISTFTQGWLARNDIVAEADALPGGFFTPVAVSQSTQMFDLLIVGDRVQIKGKGEPQAAATKIADIATRLFVAAPDRSFALTGLGFNVVFVLSDAADEDFVRRGRALLATDLSFLEGFESPEMRCGLVVACPFKGGVVATCDLKPAKDPTKTKEAYLASFNFHLDAERREAAMEMLKNVLDYLAASQSIAQKLESRLRGGV